MPCFCRDEEKSLGASILFQSFMTWLIDNENAEIIQPILLMVAYWHTFSFVFIKGNSEKQEIPLVGGIFGFSGVVKVLTLFKFNKFSISQKVTTATTIFFILYYPSDTWLYQLVRYIKSNILFCLWNTVLNIKYKLFRKD